MYDFARFPSHKIARAFIENLRDVHRWIQDYEIFTSERRGDERGTNCIILITADNGKQKLLTKSKAQRLQEDVNKLREIG